MAPRVAIATGCWWQPIGCNQHEASWCQLVGYNLEQACNRLSARKTSCAISRGLNIAHEPQLQHHNDLGLLPFALSKLEEPRTGLLQLLDEQWSIGRSGLGGGSLHCHPRLDARTDGSWHSRPRPTGG